MLSICPINSHAHTHTHYIYIYIFHSQTTTTQELFGVEAITVIERASYFPFLSTILEHVHVHLIKIIEGNKYDERPTKKKNQKSYFLKYFMLMNFKNRNSMCYWIQ